MNDRISRIQTYTNLAVAHIKSKGLGGKNQPPAPTIVPDTPEWDAWRVYFAARFRFEPVQMRRVLDKQSAEMTVPAQWPQDFDASYKPPKQIPATGPAKTYRAPPAPEWPGVWATVLVHPEDPRYARMLARTEFADPREWKIDERGLYVTFDWIDGPNAGPGKLSFEKLTNADLRRMYPPRDPPQEKSPE